MDYALLASEDAEQNLINTVHAWNRILLFIQYVLCMLHPELMWATSLSNSSYDS